MGRLDVLKSLLRGAGDRARAGVRALPPVAAVRQAVEEARARRARLDAEALTAALARAPGVVSISATAAAGAIRVDARFERGVDVAVALYPEEPRFAPRGAKEVVFRVEPPELAGRQEVAELTSALAGAIAQAAWSMLLQSAEDTTGAVVSRDAGGRLRVDLRDVPAVRRVAKKGPIAMVMEVLRPERFEAEDGVLAIHMALPELM